MKEVMSLQAMPVFESTGANHKCPFADQLTSMKSHVGVRFSGMGQHLAVMGCWQLYIYMHCIPRDNRLPPQVSAKAAGEETMPALPPSPPRAAQAPHQVRLKPWQSRPAREPGRLLFSVAGALSSKAAMQHLLAMQFVACFSGSSNMSGLSG